MLTRKNYRGLFAYPPTPFVADYSLDEDALRSNLRKLIGIGVHGIVLAGTSGESFALNPTEYRRVAEILFEETRHTDVYGVLGASALSTSEAIQRTSMAMEIGLEGVLLLQPYYLPLTRLELITFWSDLCRACPDIGVIVYHYAWIRQEYNPEIFKKLEHLPNLVGSKEAHWDFQRWLKMHRESPMAHMSSTDAGWMVELHRHNAVGVGSLQVCFMPHIVKNVLDLCAGGEYAKAEHILIPFTEFVGRMKLGSGKPHIFPSELPNWGAYSPLARHKALTDAFGFLRAGPTRPPTIAVPSKLQEQLRKFLELRYPDLLPPENFAETVEPGSKLWRRAEYSVV